MYKSKYFGFGKKSIIFCSVIISLLFISTVTAVPQINGSIAIDNLDQLNNKETISYLLSEKIKFDKIGTNDAEISSLFIFSKIIEFEIAMIDESDYQNENIENMEIDEKSLIDETNNCIISLSNSINKIQLENEFTKEEFNSIEFLKVMLIKISKVFINEFYNNNGIIKEDNTLIENGLLQRIISLILTILQFIVTIIKGILQGFFTLFSGVIKTIGAIIGIIVLFFAEVQTLLLLTGLYMISLGLLSKNIIKTLASVGAPIFAAISAFLSILTGTLLGNITAVLFSILGVIIILAIPIALIAAFLYFSGYFENGDGDGFLYILASSIVYYLKTI